MRTNGGNGNNITHAGTNFVGTAGDFTYFGAINMSAWGADFGAPNQFNNIIRMLGTGNSSLNFGANNTPSDGIVFTLARRVDDGVNDTGEAIWQWSCALNTSYRFAVAYDESDIANVPVLYLNGVAQPIQGTPTQPVNRLASWTGTSDLILMRNAACRFHSPAIWDRALSATELASITGGIAPDFYPTNLVFYADYISDAVENIGGGTGTINGGGGSWAANNFSQDAATETVTVDAATVQQYWYGFRATIDASESDAPIVADGSGNTGQKWDIPDAVYDGMMTDVAQAGLHHMRTDFDATRSIDGGTYGGRGGAEGGGTGVTYGTYVTTGLAVDNDVCDAKVDAFMRFRDAVATEGGIARWTIQFVAWNENDVHNDPGGDPGQNAVDFAMSVLERCRTVHGIIPDQITWVNEPDNDQIRGAGSDVTPAELARSLNKLVTAIDAVAGDPYRRLKIGYPEKTGHIDVSSNPVGNFTAAQYMDALVAENASLVARIHYGFHPYPGPDADKTNGLPTVPTTMATYSIGESQQGEYWLGTNANVLDDIYDQITVANASLIEAFTFGAFPAVTPNDRDWGHLVSATLNYWGTDITDYVAANRRAIVYPYVRYLQWGSRRVSETFSIGTDVRGTSWVDNQGRLVVILEELNGGPVPVTLAGDAVAGGWSAIEVDEGAGLVTVDPSAYVLAPNAVVSVVFTPTNSTVTASGTSVTTPSTAALSSLIALAATGLSSMASLANLGHIVPLNAVGTSGTTSQAGSNYLQALTANGLSDVDGAALLAVMAQIAAMGTSSVSGSAGVGSSSPALGATGALVPQDIFSGIKGVISGTTPIAAIGSLVISSQAGVTSTNFIPNATGIALIAASANLTVSNAAVLEGLGNLDVQGFANLDALYSISGLGTSVVTGTAAATENQPGAIAASGSSLTVSQANVGGLAALQALGASSVAGFATFGQVVSLAAQGISLVSGSTTLGELRQLSASGTSVIAGQTNIGTIVPIFATGQSTMNELAAFIERVNAQGTLTVGGTANVVFVGATPVQAIEIANIVEIGTPIVLLSDS